MPDKLGLLLENEHLMRELEKSDNYIVGLQKLIFQKDWDKSLSLIDGIKQIKRRLGLAEIALERLAKLGNGENYGNSVGNVIAIDALKDIKDIKENESKDPFAVYEFGGAEDWEVVKP